MIAWAKENRDNVLVIAGALVYFGLCLMGRQ